MGGQHKCIRFTDVTNGRLACLGLRCNCVTLVVGWTGLLSK
jgi:hypothetical protein